jgi:hypothetical protein
MIAERNTGHAPGLMKITRSEASLTRLSDGARFANHLLVVRPDTKNYQGFRQLKISLDRLNTLLILERAQGIITCRRTGARKGLFVWSKLFSLNCAPRTK